MIAFPAHDAMPAEVMARIGAAGDELKRWSPADTVAYAFGIGNTICAASDESNGGLFDLASLTKPLFTAPALLTLMADHNVLGADVSTVLDWPSSSSQKSIRQLMTHTAGLPAELPLGLNRDEVEAWLSKHLETDATGEARSGDWVTYSDPSYWLLGLVVSKLSGESLRARFVRLGDAYGGGFEFDRAPVQTSVPAGPAEDGVRLVHDPAARRLGQSGHAGAFGTLGGVVGAVAGWLDHLWLPERLVEACFTCQTHGTPGGHRSLAWTLSGDPFHVVAHDWPATTVSHTGFTGVSVALDPVSGWWAVYLSNAIPVERDATPVLKARRLFYAAAASHLRSVSSTLIFPDESRTT